MPDTGCTPADPAAALIPIEVLTFLSMAADPTRLRLLALLARQELHAGAIAAALALRPNAVSHHLIALSNEGLLERRRQGRWIYYRAHARILGERVASLLALLDTRQPAMRGGRPSAHEIA